MITGIIVPSDETKPLRVVEVDAEDVGTMQGIVEGSFEVFNFDTPGASIFANDEAMLYSLPHNRRATLLLWQHAKGLRGQAYISGEAILTGAAGLSGRTKSVPPDLVRLLTEAETFHVETLHDPKGRWHRRDQFDNWVDAYNHAIIQERTFATVYSARVVGK
ncbi:DUF3846 domain-containing protein [Streptomyces turgidiscabies]|uniref:DUF3846 domain-containing protein n=1 Tax=Streptomyces turgidiscabies TaxID=85558 RepID=UPI0038F81509